eukprot:GFUD01008806.1.p1 GENE.GFUD01008806.1~~GFUD01008806.1.p1  ORF type:complete len:251 (+),score=105.19 GFUD01008806.1:46-798(+)
MSGESECTSSGGQVRLDDLSFYSSSSGPAYTLDRKEPGMVQENVKMVREGLLEGVTLMRQAKEAVNHIVDTGIAHSSAAHYQLLEEDNLPARVGVIAATGLVGLVVGSLRGRLVKRVVYTMVGVGAGAAVCYPEQCPVREAGEMVYQEGRKNAMVAYNYVAGVEAGATPSLPSVEDISSMGTSTDMSLIASGMRRVLYAVARQVKVAYQMGQQQVAVLVGQKKDDKDVADAIAAPEIVVATTKDVVQGTN